MFCINKLLYLPKAELKTKNSTIWLSFGFQLDVLEKHLITLTGFTFTLKKWSTYIVRETRNVAVWEPFLVLKSV